MKAATEAKLWYWQRVSAMLLAVCVAIHLGGIIYAVHGGLSAAQILGRTHGNVLFGVFYGVFVLACAVHVPIGIANVADEMLGWRREYSVLTALLFSALIAVMGLRAVYGVVIA
jgi:succinate dehydrogenase subunit C